MPRILVIDDDESVRKMVRFRLKGAYEVMDTASPEEGLILALQHKPAAILVDLMIPTHTGFEICHTITSLSFTELIPVFVISGAPKGLYKEFCLRLGARGYFEKPIDFAALQTQLGTTVGKSIQNRRVDPRFHMRMGLKLRGTDVQGRPFEAFTSTEDVSRGGFSCGLVASLQPNTTLEVFLWIPEARRFAGEARLAWVKFPETHEQLCGFQFLGIPKEWIF